MEPEASSLTATQWLICVIAAIGFAFDIYEILVAPLVIPFALPELGGLQPGSPEFLTWVGRLFYMPAVAGGIFGLLGGYLTDRLGRRRVLTWSILLYAVSALLAGFSTSLWMLLILRCTTFIGVCVEFVAAVAWLAELFPNRMQRERVLGWTQAFSSVGGLLVAWANWTASKYGTHFPAINLPGWIHFGQEIGFHDSHSAWRYTLMSGLIPAIPLILIRPFLPESPVWKEKKLAGTLQRPSLAALFSPALLRTTVVTTIMFACSYGAAFGAIQQMPQIVPGLPEVQEAVKKGIAALPPVTKPATPAAATKPVAAAKPDPRVRAKTRQITNENAANVTKIQEYGGLVGRVILALLATVIVSRRSLIRIFQVPGLIVMPLVFGLCAVTGLVPLKIGMFVAGLLTVAQFSFWGNYLPRVYPVHLRGTGESFAANIGGRMIGTSFAWVAATLAAMFAQSNPSPVAAAHAMAYAAAIVGTGVYVVGLAASFFLPEPSERV
ncbi:MAG: MFS transporter [Tepidisphaeraceae bacterium]